MYKVIMKVDCPFCRKAVDLLSEKKLPFVVVVVDNSEEFLQEQKRNYNWPTVPIVLEVDSLGKETLVGGFTELNEKLSKVNSNRKILLND